jgi:hypothetical protein
MGKLHWFKKEAPIEWCQTNVRHISNNMDLMVFVVTDWYFFSCPLALTPPDELQQASAFDASRRD